MTYHDPVNYTFYKYSFYKKFCNHLGIKLAKKGERYAHYLNLLEDFIEKHLVTDTELIEQVNTYLPDFSDGTNHKLLAQDILYQMLDKKVEPNYWIFQGSPDDYDFETALRDGVLTGWTVTAHKNKIKSGDKVILWITGQEAGCYALAEVSSEPYTRTASPDDHLWKNDTQSYMVADIKITHNLVDHPILKKEIEGIEELDNLKVGNRGTNLPATEKEFKKFISMIGDKDNSRQYWLYSPGENARKWVEFYDEGIIGIGWDEIGDLKQYKSRTEIKNALVTAYGGTGSKKNDLSANDDFLNKMNNGDTIIVKKGRSELLGYGTVISDYQYDENRTEYQKIRKVDWVLKGNWKVDFNLVLKTLTNITPYSTEDPIYNTFYDRLLGIMTQDKTAKAPADLNYPLNTIFYGPPGTGKTYNTILRAAEIIENRTIKSYDEAREIFKANLHNRIEFITFHQNYSYEDFIQGLRPDVDEANEQLKFKKSDGVFKIIADRALANLRESDKAPEEISQQNAFSKALETLKVKILESEEPVKINEAAYFTAVEDDAFRYTGDNWASEEKRITGFRMKFSDLERFHEEGVTERKEIKDIEGISGLAKQHATYYFQAFELVKSLMPETTKKVKTVKRKNYVIIIDEINRANISRVFGELITLIEPDKRSEGDIALEARLPSGDPFVVPSNLYIIGTMNTADKSIALLDIALRRRFEFEPMYPLYDIVGTEIHDVEILEKINKKIIKSKGHDFQIGHSYFMGENKDLVKRMNNKVIPLLLEYYMNDQKEVEDILRSAGLVIKENSWPLKITDRDD